MGLPVESITDRFPEATYTHTYAHIHLPEWKNIDLYVWSNIFFTPSVPTTQIMFTGSRRKKKIIKIIIKKYIYIYMYVVSRQFRKRAKF